jgi:hypothetical protein
MKTKAPDGRPNVVVGGSGKMIKPDTTQKVHFIKPNARQHETGDYKYLDHPAFRRWKWIGEDIEGRAIYMEGNMWIHPSAYNRLYSLFGRSKIKEYTLPESIPIIGGKQPGSGALAAGGFIKASILVGPFHHAHMAEHAIFHKVNPLNPRPIDFKTRLLLKEGVDRGLMLYSHNPMVEFSEGLASGGLWHRVPGMGKYLQMYQDWLFTDYIPRLKAEMFEHAVARAEKYYEKQLKSGELTRDQLLENAALQSNAAFGEQNYKYLGRNPSIQDALRLALLAPDFLEARFRFAGQAVKPYGKEQAMALLRGAVIMGATAQIINLMFGDDRKVDWKHPFTFKVSGREITPRSVVGDVFHFFNDPRGFWNYRLSPLWGRPLASALTGRDFAGRKIGFTDWVTDILKSWVVIPAQEIVRRPAGQDILESVWWGLLSSVGLSNRPAQTNLERFSMRMNKPIYPKTEHSQVKIDIINTMKRDKQEGRQAIKEALKTRKITDEDIKDIEERVFHPARAISKRMTLEQLADAVKSISFTDEEKRDIYPVFSNKINIAMDKGYLDKGEKAEYIELLKKLKR